MTECRWSLVAVVIAMLTTAHSYAHDHRALFGEVGTPGRRSDIDRTVRVDMSDAMRFSPARVAATQGETIRFVVTNSGQLRHEFVLGTDEALSAHAQAMKRFPGMEHSEPNMISLAGGQSGELIWRFTGAGAVSFACLQAGHYDDGMRGVVEVTSATKR
jgi:uncharacterized cupredoxin-like copper-binding protein